MHDSRSLRCSLASACTLLTAVAAMLFPAVPVGAQAISAGEEQQEQKNEPKEDYARIGIFFSGRGIDSALECAFANVYDSGPCDTDLLAYPFVHTSIRSNSYQGIFFWSKDDNESIVHATVRYNYYPFKKGLYAFAGLSVWNVNRKTFYNRAVDTDRPEGRSLTPGITVGIGLEYTLFGFIVLSHEGDFYLSGCTYEDFIDS